VLPEKHEPSLWTRMPSLADVFVFSAYPLDGIARPRVTWFLSLHATVWKGNSGKKKPLRRAAWRGDALLFRGYACSFLRMTPATLTNPVPSRRSVEGSGAEFVDLVRVMSSEVIPFCCPSTLT